MDTFIHIARAKEIAEECRAMGLRDGAHNRSLHAVLDPAFQTLSAVTRNAEDFRRRGQWNGDVAAQMQAAVAGVMEPLEAFLRDIRSLTPLERQTYGLPKPYVPKHGEVPPAEIARRAELAECEADVAMLAAADELGARFTVIPGEFGKEPVLMVDGMGKLPADMQARIRARKRQIIAQIILSRTV